MWWALGTAVGLVLLALAISFVLALCQAAARADAAAERWRQ